MEAAPLRPTSAKPSAAGGAPRTPLTILTARTAGAETGTFPRPPLTAVTAHTAEEETLTAAPRGGQSYGGASGFRAHRHRAPLTIVTAHTAGAHAGKPQEVPHAAQAVVPGSTPSSREQPSKGGESPAMELGQTVHGTKKTSGRSRLESPGSLGEGHVAERRIERPATSGGLSSRSKAKSRSSKRQGQEGLSASAQALLVLPERPESRQGPESLSASATARALQEVGVVHPTALDQRRPSSSLASTGTKPDVSTGNDVSSDALRVGVLALRHSQPTSSRSRATLSDVSMSVSELSGDVIARGTSEARVVLSHGQPVRPTRFELAPSGHYPHCFYSLLPLGNPVAHLRPHVKALPSTQPSLDGGAAEAPKSKVELQTKQADGGSVAVASPEGSEAVGRSRRKLKLGPSRKPKASPWPGTEEGAPEVSAHRGSGVETEGAESQPVMVEAKAEAEGAVVGMEAEAEADDGGVALSEAILSREASTGSARGAVVEEGRRRSKGHKAKGSTSKKRGVGIPSDATDVTGGAYADGGSAEGGPVKEDGSTSREPRRSSSGKVPRGATGSAEAAEALPPQDQERKGDPKSSAKKEAEGGPKERSRRKGGAKSSSREGKAERRGSSSKTRQLAPSEESLSSAPPVAAEAGSVTPQGTPELHHSVSASQALLKSTAGELPRGASGGQPRGVLGGLGLLRRGSEVAGGAIGGTGQRTAEEGLGESEERGAEQEAMQVVMQVARVDTHELDGSGLLAWQPVPPASDCIAELAALPSPVQVSPTTASDSPDPPVTQSASPTSDRSAELSVLLAPGGSDSWESSSSHSHSSPSWEEMTQGGLVTKQGSLVTKQGGLVTKQEKGMGREGEEEAVKGTEQLHAETRATDSTTSPGAPAGQPLERVIGAQSSPAPSLAAAIPQHDGAPPPPVPATETAAASIAMADGTEAEAHSALVRRWLECTSTPANSPREGLQSTSGVPRSPLAVPLTEQDLLRPNAEEGSTTGPASGSPPAQEAAPASSLEHAKQALRGARPVARNVTGVPLVYQNGGLTEEKPKAPPASIGMPACPLPQVDYGQQCGHQKGHQDAQLGQSEQAKQSTAMDVVGLPRFCASTPSGAPQNGAPGSGARAFPAEKQGHRGDTHRSSSSKSLVVRYGPFLDTDDASETALDGRMRKLVQMRDDLEAMAQHWDEEERRLSFTARGRGPAQEGSWPGPGLRAQAGGGAGSGSGTEAWPAHLGSGRPATTGAEWGIHRSSTEYSNSSLFDGFSAGEKDTDSFSDTCSDTEGSYRAWAHGRGFTGGYTRGQEAWSRNSNSTADTKGVQHGMDLRSVRRTMTEWEPDRNDGGWGSGSQPGHKSPPPGHKSSWDRPRVAATKVLVVPSSNPGTITVTLGGVLVCTIAPGREEYMEPTGVALFDDRVDQIIGIVSEFHHSSYYDLE